MRCMTGAGSLLLMVGLVGVKDALAQVASTKGVGILQITVALVGPNAVVKPIPLHELQLRGMNDSVYTEMRTALDGHAQAELPSGGYTLASIKPVTVDGVGYRWQVAVQVSAGRPVVVELTNANADSTVGNEAPAASGGRELAPEMKVFGRVREGVVRVLAGIASGTAFLVDSTGLFLTNAHVVDGVGDATLSVMLDTLTRVPARVVVRATETDLAVIQVNPQFARGRPVARLDPNASVQVGERVFALGYPLGLELVLTSGVVSSTRDGAVISDVNINHGNSGGPMYAMDGTIVAVNTFLVDGANGPGVSGSIPISRAFAVVAEAQSRAPTMQVPGTELLPVLPRASIPVAEVKTAIGAAPNDIWRSYSSIGIDRFIVDIQTPFQAVAVSAALEAEIGKDRKKRESKSGVDQQQQYSELRGLHDWQYYTSGSITSERLVPVVGINVTPKIGETSGSIWRRSIIAGLSGANSKATIRYKADLRSAAIYRNRDTVVPFMGGAQPVRQYVNDKWVDMRDVANTGYYLISIQTFAPEADGTPPVITIVLQDLKNPDDPSCGTLEPALVASIWNQFEGYVRSAGSDFTVSDAAKKRAGANEIAEAFCKSSPVAQETRPF